MVSRVLGFCLLLGVAFAGCTGSADGEDGPSASNGTLLRGVVVDQAIRPLAQARVVAVGNGVELNTTTDGDGLFNFTGLAAGVYVLTVSKGFYSTQQLTVPIASNEEPPLVKVELTLETGVLPFANQVKWEGFIECSASIGNWCGIVNLYPCIVQSQVGQPCTRVNGDNSFLFLKEFFTDLQRSPDWLQIEAYWESTQSLSPSLALRYAATNQSEWDAFSFGPVLAEPIGESPLVATANATAMADAGLGTTRGLTTELFHGRNDAVPPEAEDACIPDVGCWTNQWLGLAANQRISVVYMAFYGYVPPEGWTLAASGEVPPP